MKIRIRSIAIAAFVLVVVTELTACGDAAAKTGASHGVVKAVDASARTMTLDHADIPGLMPAMTMPFAVAPEVSLEGLEPGAQVDFTVKQDAGGYTVTELERR